MKNLFPEIPTLNGDRVTLRPLEPSDAESLRELTEDEEVYRYLPTFLYEKKYEDKAYVIEHLYDECIKDSLILGVFMDDSFCGLAEIYGYRRSLSKVSVGYRLLQNCWGKGIATETLGVMVKYLMEEKNIRIITASTMVKNTASANVLKKNGFKHMTYTIFENWGYYYPIKTEKWIRTAPGNRLHYSFQH